LWSHSSRKPFKSIDFQPKHCPPASKSECTAIKLKEINGTDLRNANAVFLFLLSRIETSYKDDLCDFFNNILSLYKEYIKINS